ncbi:MAG: flagellar hook-associated protein FlgK [Sphingomonas fennica]
MVDLLNIGRSGVIAYRNALSTVGENVANAQTEGFVRRKIVLSEAPTGISNLGERPGAFFSGVSPGIVERAWNEYRAGDVSTGLADAGRGEARLRWLSKAEEATGNGALGVGTQMGAVFNAGDALASDPASAVRRAAFLSAVDGTTEAMKTTARALSAVSDGIATETQANVAALNGDLKSLVAVNEQISRTSAGSSQRAQALDDRDRLIASISGRIGIDTRYDAVGRATVTVADAPGRVLASVTEAASVEAVVGATGAIALVTRSETGQTALPITSGTLSGLVDVSTTVADRRSALNTLAVDFAAALNDWQAAGVTDAGAPGDPILTGTDALSIARAPTATAAALAVASPPPAGATRGVANGNALALATVRTTSGLEQRWSGGVTGLAQAVTVARAESNAANARRDAAEAALDSGSGVDLDYEASELLRFQQAYSASAKIIQAARDTFQTILQLF